MCDTPRGLDESLLLGHAEKCTSIASGPACTISPTEMRGEDKTEPIFKTAHCSYLNCFHT